MYRVGLLALLLALAPRVEAQGPPARLTLDWPAVAAELVERLALEPGEKVISICHPGRLQELVRHLRYEVARAGGVDLGCLEVLAEPVPLSWRAGPLVSSKAAARAAFRTMLAGVDAALMLPGAQPGHPAYAALQDLLREHPKRTIHFHWTEGSAIPLPGQPLPPTHEIEASYQRALLETDYRAVATSQRRFEEAARTGEVRVTTALGTDLRFRIGDRPLTRQDGDASAARARQGRVLIDRELELPCGAIRVAPLEESVSGVIAFPPSQWSRRPVEGLELTLAAGRVVAVEATSGREHALAELDSRGTVSRSFREFALGFNPELAVPEQSPWIPYYGYGAGVVRLSLGDNSELGGAVRDEAASPYVRWNFFVDATVTVAGETWIERGRLVR